MLAEGCSPHAVAGLMRAQGRPPGRRVCAETIYAACYDPAGGRGLAAGSWRCLVRCRRRRKRRGRCEQARRGPLGQFRPLSERPAAVGGRCEAGHWEGDLIIGARNRSAGGHPRGAHQPLHAARRAPRRLQRRQGRLRRGRNVRPGAVGHGQDADLGQGQRDGPLAPHRG